MLLRSTACRRNLCVCGAVPTSIAWHRRDTNEERPRAGYAPTAASMRTMVGRGRPSRHLGRRCKQALNGGLGRTASSNGQSSLGMLHHFRSSTSCSNGRSTVRSATKRFMQLPQPSDLRHVHADEVLFQRSQVGSRSPIFSGGRGPPMRHAPPTAGQRRYARA